MGLDDLAQAVERVRETAKKHEKLLSQNEALTRYCLIDPILRALGWDTTDPQQVRVEEAAGGGKADYVLLDGNGSYLMLIEAKKLAQKLPPVATTEVIKYAGFLLHGGKLVRQLVVTNGLLWDIYEYPNLAQIYKVDVGEPKKRPREAAIELARALWRPLLQGEFPPPPPPPPPPDALVGLNELSRLVKPKSPPPKRVVFPDGSQRPVELWKELLVAVTDYLLHAFPHSLQPPIKAPGGTKYLLHSQPVHSSGDAFFNAKKVGSLYLETDWSAADTVKRAVYLLQLAKQNPDDFKVELRQ